MTENKYKKIIAILGENRILLDESLAKYSSFQIGGPADLFFRAQSEIELINAITLARENKIPIFVMGGGTNLLISDFGFHGLVIKNESKKIKMVGMRGNKKSDKKSVEVKDVLLEVDSGVGINRLVRYTIDQGLSGLEYFLGQPGTIGGGVYINAHNMSMGKFLGDTVHSAKVIDLKNDVRTVSKDYFKFGYDQSSIQSTGDIVLSVVLLLKKAEKSKLWDIAQKALEHRKKTQPAGYYSSGCIFRNIRKSDAHRIATPNYTCSAGYLIESVGLKNVKEGTVHFSDDHANFIVHRGGATARDVLKLINCAKSIIKKKYFVDLKEEIVKVGNF